MKRALVSIVAGAAMLSSGSLAFAGSAPLAPAGAAGVKKAEGMDNRTILLIGGGAVVVAGLALVLSDTGNGHGTPSTCSPTDPTGCGGGSGGTGSSGTH